ncbi:sugar ABC transporter ATP-binding protein [Brevibacillus nitrificans]|uniref:sugar ABC transporter ATP-binding protein n=1 Tax=Brevibacillus nitrificans TaxID=651560 RepID=UPI002860CDBF|nr:sugar ABC transporter ATP-binding protein [Brevibacillus nitrificans]MDR7316396.1 simple sugar transport system ATP-binding protein [Brevibacillus nitrificans]
MSLIQLSGISKSFAGVQALKDVSIELDYGEIHCLAGENGCGKSTLIKVMSGVHAPDHGEMRIHGQKRKLLTPIDAINEGIQVIYQDFSIFPNLTVAENIALNTELAQNRKLVNWRRMKQMAKQALEKVNVQLDLDAKVETLSVADKQLIAISRALMHKAKLIIMDEPTTALTQKEVRSLFSIINGLKREGMTILFVSHKLEEVFEISERITILRNGKNVVSERVQQLDRDKLVFYMTGRKIEESFYEIKEDASIPILQTEDLGLQGCFEHISLQVKAGEIVGLTGLLGSGRTELAESLFGLRSATSGKIFIEGKEQKIHSVQDAIAQRIAYVPEDRLTEGLFLEQSIERNMVISVVDQLSNRSHMINRTKVKSTVQDWIKSLGIVAHSPALPVKTLSGGNQQRVVLAKWLATRPRLLILNGPTVGVDIGSKEDIHQVIRALAKEGMGVLMISDDFPELKHNCNRVLLMKNGRLVGEMAGKEWSQEEWARLQETTS